MNLKISIRGDKIVVTKAIKDYLHEKLERLNKYFKNSEDIKCNVIIRVKNNLQTVEVSIPTSKFNIRCEEGSDNLYASIDMIIDKNDRYGKMYLFWSVFDQNILNLLERKVRKWIYINCRFLQMLQNVKVFWQHRRKCISRNLQSVHMCQP